MTKNITEITENRQKAPLFDSYTMHATYPPTYWCLQLKGQDYSCKLNLNLKGQTAT